MKQVLFILLMLSTCLSVKAQTDTLNLDSFCFVFIAFEPTGSGANLTAYAFDLSDPVGGDFDYLWNTGDTDQSIPLPGPGTYDVTATSINTGCEAVSTITVDPQSCEVSAWLNFDGTMTAFGSGIPPFTYLWDTGDTVSTIPVVVGDTYCVTVTDFVGCVVDSCFVADYGPVDTFCLTEILVHPDSVGNIILTAFNIGDIILPPGQSNASYLWSTGDTTESIIASDPSGTYCVTVTTPLCSEEACIDLNDSQCGLWIGCDPPGMFTAFSWGVPPYTYIWNTGETTESIDVDPGQTYCVTVTDALGCINDTCMLADTIIFPPIDSFCEVYVDVQVTANGITLFAHAFPFWGGNFTYEWDNGETTESIIGLPNETYCVTVTSSDGCVASTCVDLGDYDCSDLFVLCDPGGGLGVFSSGIPPFSYQWSTGDTTEFIMGEVDSTYCVTITDALNCVADTCITLQGFPVDTFPVDTFDFGSIIVGEVYAADPSTILSGFVYLYQKDDTDMFVIVDSVDVQTNGIFGGYFFSMVEAGEYITKAVVVDLITGDEYIPTYHFSAATWSDADVITVVPSGPAGPFTLYDAPIELLGTVSLDGPGSISGAVVDLDDLTGGSSRSGEGMEGVTLILTNQAGETFEFDYSDEDGAFSFTDLPYGTYQLHADHLNFSGSYATIVLDATNENGVINFEVSENELFLNNNEVDLTTEIDIYPNPVSDRLVIELTDDIQINSIYLTDISGKQVKFGQLNSGSKVELNTSEVSTGIYFLNILTDRGALNEKIMVSN